MFITFNLNFIDNNLENEILQSCFFSVRTMIWKCNIRGYECQAVIEVDALSRLIKLIKLMKINLRKLTAITVLKLWGRMEMFLGDLSECPAKYRFSCKISIK